MAREATSAAEAVARRSYGKLVAFLATRMGDVEAAEDALTEVLTALVIRYCLYKTIYFIADCQY
jgi:predicted RNA polymerase sigma factor